MKRKQNIIRFDSNVGANHSDSINPFIVSAEEHTTYKYKARLWGEFLSSEDFLNVVEVLETATPDDDVEIHISSCGGSGAAISTLIYAMNKCEAPIHIVMTGTVASAATLPMFCADSFEIAEDCSFLFHEAILGSPPETMAANKEYTAHAYKHIESLLRNAYEYFFEEEEFAQLFAGRQIYMFADEVVSRFNKRTEILQARQDIAEEYGDEEFEEPFETVDKKKTIH